MEVNDMKIYVLLKQVYEGSETVIVSEDINKNTMNIGRYTKTNGVEFEEEW